MFGDDDDDPIAAGDPIRVLICDQHDLVRRSLTTLLEESRSLEVVAEAADGSEAVAESLHGAPDVAFVSLWLPDLTGITAIGLIAEVMPSIDVVALSVEEPAEERFAALRAGAGGVVDKEQVLASAAATVERLLRGVPFVDAEVAALVLEHVEGSAPVTLSGPERAVLECLAAEAPGGPWHEDLDLGPAEVRNHVRNVLGRLQAAAPPELDEEALSLLVRAGA